MAKQTESHKKAVIKYRKDKAKQLRVQYTVVEYNRMAAYCNHISTPIGTWIHELTRKAIDSDSSFIYTPTDDSELNNLD